MSKAPVVLAAQNRETAKRLIRGATKGANLPDSMLVEYPGRNDSVLLEQPPPRTGVLQEEFVQDEHGTGRAKVKLHIVDFENSNAEDGLRLKLGEEEVKAYCATLGETETIASETPVVLLYINDRWTIVLGGGGTGTIIPVNLELASGSEGSATAMCSFKYYVQHVLTEAWWTDNGWGEEKDRIEVDPIVFPHRWRRTTVGRYVAANYGHAHNGTDDEGKPLLALGWINEVIDLLACI